MRALIVSLTAVVLAVASCSARGEPDYTEAQRRVSVAFECSELAKTKGSYSEADRLFQYGMEVARGVFSAFYTGKLYERAEVNVGRQWLHWWVRLNAPDELVASSVNEFGSREFEDRNCRFIGQ